MNVNLKAWWRDGALALAVALAAYGLRLRSWLARGRAAVAGGEVGQSMVEYALIAALVAIVCMTAVGVFGTAIGTVFTNMTSKVSGLGR